MNYKVGDKVTIQKPSKKQLKLWDNCWVDDMDKYIGEEYIIAGIDKYLSFENIIYNFPLCMIEYSIETNYEIY